MAAVVLKDSAPDPELAQEFRRALAGRHGIIAPVYAFSGKLWLRISAQIYNEPDDYLRCAAACLDLRESFLAESFR